MGPRNGGEERRGEERRGEERGEVCGISGIRTHGLRNARSMVYQLSSEIYWEQDFIFNVFNTIPRDKNVNRVCMRI